MEQEDDRGDATVEVEIPAALADRIDRIFTDCRGYPPRSTQESLSVLCDLASGRLTHSPDPPADDGGRTSRRVEFPASAERRPSEAVDDPPEPDSRPERNDDTRPEPTDGEGSEPDDGSDLADRIDDAFPARWGAEPTIRRRLTDVVERYVDNPNEFATREEREADAIAGVARRESLSPDDLLDDLVAALYGNAGLPDDLAAEFFSEALVSLVEDGETGHGENGAGDDDAAAFRGELTDDVVPEDLGDDAFDVDSLLGEVSQPTAECERCGSSHPVNDLDTVIGSKTATIELLCRDCAAGEE